MTKPKKLGVNPKLAKAVSDMLDEVMGKPAAGAEPFTLTDKCKIIDRFTKLEMIRLKIADDGEGDFFRNRRPTEDEDDGND